PGCAGSARRARTHRRRRGTADGKIGRSRMRLVITGVDVARLPFDLPLRCPCGHVRGVAREVSPASGVRFLCYCKACQPVARFLERADGLDSAGGTDIFQMPPARVKLTTGTDALRCLRFSSKVIRWYTDCCRTPIGNTAADPRFPVLALIHCF